MQTVALCHNSGMALTQIGDDKKKRRETRTDRMHVSFKPSILNLLNVMAQKTGDSPTAAIEDAVKDAARHIPIMKEIQCDADSVIRAAKEQTSGRVNVAELFDTEEGDFLWKVRGSSMTGGGVEEGDFILIRPQSAVDNNEVAIVMVTLPTGKRPALRRICFSGNSPIVELVSLLDEKDVIKIDTTKQGLEICGVKRGVIKGR